MSKISLFHGDCLEKMQTIPDNSVDMILTSPPYNMNLRIRNGKYCSRGFGKDFTTKYTEFRDDLTMDEYFRFHKSVIDECLRISDLVFYNVQFITGNKVALFNLIGEFSSKLKEFIIWDKVNAEPAIGQRILNSQFEVILVFQKSAPMARQFETAQFDRGTLSNLWRIKRGKRILRSHKAVFPEELAHRVITNFSRTGATVCDPFMGAGTTGVVCKKTNRNFIGIELNKDYFEFAKNRINEV